MTKLLIGLLGAGVLATAGFAASTGLDDTTPARTVSLPAATTTGTTADDTSAEGTSTAATTTDAAADNIVVGGTTGVDVSGPCDEAEHAGDPRCTGGVDADHEGDDDGHHSGHGRGGDDEGDHGGDDDDRSGSNSGKG
jgi:hypothetical protein